MKACGVPTFSARHFMSEIFPLVWMSWHLSDELPAFTTSTSMAASIPGGWGRREAREVYGWLYPVGAVWRVTPVTAL